MIRSAPITIAVNKTSPAKHTESSLHGADNLLEQNAGFESAPAAGFSSAKKGFDLAQIPARPGLQAGLGVQRCGKDGKPCSCPKCKVKAAGEEESAEAEKLRNSASRMQSVQPASGTETATSQSQAETEGAVSADTSTSAAGAVGASGGLIIDDASADVGEGKMKKTAFLQQLRSEICSTIGPVLAIAGQTTEGCPYLNYWLDLYQGKNASEVEATVRKYAPDSANATNASQYVSIVTQRALRAAVVWATTGQLSGIPEGVPTTLPAETGTQAGGNPGSQAVTIRAKAKPGGSKNVDNPAAVQKELGNGSPLASDVRSRMENAFGMNFSHVRTHTDAGAAELSERANARAFAVGNHVAFGSGEYRPGTLLGDALIAHELAHVVQQKDASASVDKMENTGAGYQALEQDADYAATGVISKLWEGKNDTMKSNVRSFMPTLRSGLRLQHCSRNQKVPTKNISVQPIRIAEDNGSTPTTVPSFGEAQTIWRNCCVNISVNSATTISESDYKTLDDPGVGSTPSAEETAMFTAAGSSGTSIPVFIPHTLTDGTTTSDDISGGGVSYFSGTPNPRLVVVEAIHPRIIAHELGHAMGYTSHTTGTVMEATGAHNVAPPSAVNSSICSTVRGYTNHTTSGSNDCSTNP